jgi:hypothetical protein
VNVELFDKAVEFIEEIPDAQLMLSDWQSVSMTSAVVSSSEEVHCGTIACAGGWLALNPDFEELGVTVGITGIPRFGSSAGYTALAHLFGLPKDVAISLFDVRSSPYDGCQFGEVRSLMTDRQLWLSRARLVRVQYADKT